MKKMGKEMINGNKIFLRALEVDDSDKYYRWINDSETKHWSGLNHPMSKEASLVWIKEQSDVTKEKMCFAICKYFDDKSSQQSHELIGFIGLRGICLRSRRAEIWIYLGEKRAWGQGIASDAVKTFCKYAFEEMNLYRIWAELDPENIGSFRSLQKNNFIKEGTFRAGYYRHGQYRDTIVMALLRSDWEQVHD